MNRSILAGALAGLLTLCLAGVSSAETKSGAPRRLEDVYIEGEIPVPQVLFITTRDQRRFMDFHHRRYLRTSLELGQATALPVWSTVLAGPVGEQKEIQP